MITIRNNNNEEFTNSKSKIDMSNLKTARERLNYSQVKLQHPVGVSTSSTEAYEQGVRISSLPVAYRLSEVLNCSIDYLVGKNNELEKYHFLSKENKEKVNLFIDSLTEKE